MEKDETQKVVKKISKKFNKKEKMIKCMIQILKENYTLKEIEETIISFYKNNN